MNIRSTITCAFLTATVLIFSPVDLRAQEDQSGKEEPLLIAEAGEDSGEHGSSTESKHDGESGEHGEDSGGWNTFWKPAITQFIAFLLLIGVYVKWVHPLLKTKHRERRDRIQSDLDQVEQELEEIDEREEEIEEKMATIEERAKEKRERIIEKGKQLKQETIEEAEEYAEEAIENARAEAERIRERAVIELQNEMTGAALTAIRRYFRDEEIGDLHEKFQRDFLDSLADADSISSFERRPGNCSSPEIS